MKNFFMLFGLIISQFAYSDNELNVHVQLNHTYELKAQYPIVVDKDRFIFSRYDKTGNTKEIVSIDPLSGSEKILVGGNYDSRYLADNNLYVAFYVPGRSVPGKVKLLRKSDGKIFQSVRLAQGAFGAYFLHDQLMVLQILYSIPKSTSYWNVPNLTTLNLDLLTVLQKQKQEKSLGLQPISQWSVFNLPTLKFMREFDAPAVQKMVHLPQEVVMLTNNHIGLYDETLKEKFATDFPHEPIRNAYCEAESLIVLNRLAIFIANCGEIYSFSLTDGKLQSRLRLKQRFYSLASDGRYLFAVPKLPVDLPEAAAGVAIDLSTWKVVGRFQAMGGTTYANNSTLAVMSFPNWSKGKVSVYSYSLVPKPAK